MESLVLIRSILFSLLLAGLAVPAFADRGCAGLAGTWVLPVDGRNLMVLRIGPAAGDPAPFAGSLTLPLHLVWTRDSVSHITGGNRRRMITSAICEDGLLQLTIEKPDAPGDGSHFSLTPSDGQHARLQLIVAGVDSLSISPFNLTRADETSTVAEDWEETRTYLTPAEPSSNAEMLVMFDADQDDLLRRPVDLQRIAAGGAERRKATRRLLDAGALHSGEDFFRAALIFQHGTSPDDFLFAHTLAMVALAKGDRDALSMATVTLDRYLLHVKQPQIYGTQFNGNDHPAEEEPYNRALIPDVLRVELGVPTHAEQLQRFKEIEAERMRRSQPAK